MKILLLEDDLILSDILTHHLRESGFEVIHVEDGESALECATESKFDLMLLDINVPKKSGLEVVKTLREYNNTTPAIIITAYHDTSHMKNGFESGCDDYIKKPFDLEELDLRIKNIQKRFSIESEDEIKLDIDTTLVSTKNRLVVQGKEYQLANKECEILGYLLAHKKRVVSSDELMQNLWEYESMPSDATIRVYIKNLRNILGKDRIKTIRGSGYYFE
ncbi:response regulator transcription factor [Sulfurospirillum arcachonense]|uniref:response regulator transcription factor n=1 Tax=Sulfurospirillum arcachonense TaxID=57666 RepID=UPI0004691C25|nr:response regulator transcription factor [Sulfurospirillum arcachonense]